MYHKTNLQFKEELESRGITTSIILLHSADTKPHSVEDVHKSHQKKYGMAGIAYHYFIKKNGEIYEGRPHDTKGAFLKEYNSNSIGVCFEGDFNKEKMNEVQMSSSILLLSLLSLAYQAGTILPYWRCKKEWKDPGLNFPFDKILKRVDDCRDHFTTLFGNHWGETEEEYFVPDYEWRHCHDHLGDEEEEWHRHNAPADYIHMGNFNYFKILNLLSDIEENYYWEKEDYDWDEEDYDGDQEIE